MTSRHEDRDGNLNGTFGLRRERGAGLYLFIGYEYTTALWCTPTIVSRLYSQHAPTVAR